MFCFQWHVIVELLLSLIMLRLFAYDELLLTLLCCVRLRVSSRYWLCCVAFGCVVDNCSFRTSISAFSRCTSASFSAFKRSISACISARSFANSSASFDCCEDCDCELFATYVQRCLTSSTHNHTNTIEPQTTTTTPKHLENATKCVTKIFDAIDE